MDSATSSGFGSRLAVFSDSGSGPAWLCSWSPTLTTEAFLHQTLCHCHIQSKFSIKGGRLFMVCSVQVVTGYVLKDILFSRLFFLVVEGVNEELEQLFIHLLLFPLSRHLWQWLGLAVGTPSSINSSTNCLDLLAVLFFTTFPALARLASGGASVGFAGLGAGESGSLTSSPASTRALGLSNPEVFPVRHRLMIAYEFLQELEGGEKPVFIGPRDLKRLLECVLISEEICLLENVHSNLENWAGLRFFFIQIAVAFPNWHPANAWILEANPLLILIILKTFECLWLHTLHAKPWENEFESFLCQCLSEYICPVDTLNESYGTLVVTVRREMRLYAKPFCLIMRPSSIGFGHNNPDIAMYYSALYDEIGRASVAS
ncbi:hypothetical protein Tco_0200534 [Tanacetum coccineum]